MADRSCLVGKGSLKILFSSLSVIRLGRIRSFRSAVRGHRVHLDLNGPLLEYGASEMGLGAASLRGHRLRGVR